MNLRPRTNAQVQDVRTKKQWGLALFWAALGALSTAAVIPYTLAIFPALQAKISLPLPLFLILQMAQTGAMLLLLSWLGLRLGQSVGLDSPFARALVYGRTMPPLDKRRLLIALVAGAATALVIALLDKAFHPFMPPTTLPLEVSVALWKRLLACLYGGIAEELLLRLGLMTLLVWFIWKLARPAQQPPTALVFWIAIVLAAILFGVGHLPAAAGVWPLTPVVVIRVVVLNALGGITFGYLYWRHGLEHAMAAHFLADILMHVVLAGQ